MATISGILTDGTGQIINNCTIELYAKKTTSSVLTQTQAFRVAENGKYSMTVLPCDYDVNLVINGFPKKRLGTIQVFSDSSDGTLNDYLLNPAESEVTPAILQQVLDLRNDAKQSANNAGQSAKNSKTSETNAEKSSKNAKNSETNSVSSAKLASESATIANNASQSAKNSESSAKTSADNAAKFADSAGQSANNAGNSATSAKTAETGAQTSATEAKQSALDAKNWASTVDLKKHGIGNRNLLSDVDSFQLNGFGFVDKKTKGNTPFEYAEIIQSGNGKFESTQIALDLLSNRVKIRSGRVNKWNEWCELITTANSTVDSNGFYKKSSPILRLYGTENIELIAGFTIAGCGLVNDLATGVIATRIDVGHYEICGSLGFAREGWYIQLPEDANGNKKFFADYSADASGIITIKTFTKKFDFEKCEIIAGEPVDITDGRWIDVRLEMPVVEEETTEIIEEDSTIDEPTIDDENS